MRIYRNLLYIYVCILSTIGRNIINCDEIALTEDVTSDNTQDNTQVTTQTVNSTDVWKFTEISSEDQQEVPEIPDLPFEYELVQFTEPKDAKKPLILDIEWKFTSTLFEYKKTGDISTYYAANDYVFRLITQYSKILWDPHDYSQCSEKVEYNEANKSVIIHKLDGTTEKIQLNLIVVNINKRVSTERVTYEKDDWTNTHIFTAKDPFLIAKVKNGTETVWTSSSKNFPNKLFLRPGKNDDNILELHYPDHSSDSKLFDYREDLRDTCQVHFKGKISDMTVKYGIKGVWKSEKIPENGFVSIKKNKNEMLLTSKFTIGIVTLGSKEPNDPRMYYFHKVSDTEGHYIFHKRVKCTEIWANGRKIWNHNRKEYGATFPKAVSYYGPDEIHVSFSDFLMVLVGDGDDWEPLFYDYHDIIFTDEEASDPNQAADPNQQQDPAQQSTDANQTDPNQEQDPNQQKEQADPNQSSDQQELEESEEQEENEDQKTGSSTKPNPSTPNSSTHITISSKSPESNEQEENEEGEQE